MQILVEVIQYLHYCLRLGLFFPRRIFGQMLEFVKNFKQSLWSFELIFMIARAIFVWGYLQNFFNHCDQKFVKIRHSLVSQFSDINNQVSDLKLFRPAACSIVHKKILGLQNSLSLYKFNIQKMAIVVAFLC